SQHGFDVRLTGRAMHLHGAPCLGKLAERHPTGLGVHVLPRDNRRRHLVEPPLRIRLPREVARVLVASQVPVSSAPHAIRPPSQTRHHPAPVAASSPLVLLAYRSERKSEA